MSSLSLSLKLMLAASALAGVTLLACGEDPAPAPTKGSNSNNDDDDDDDDDDTATTKKDAGSTTKKDAGSTTKKDAGAVIVEGESGDDCEGTTRAQCTTCDKAPCFTTCEDGTYGECMSLTGAIDTIKDAGKIVTDAGTFTAGDGQVSVQIGDSSVVVPPMDCPAPLVCTSKSTAASVSIIMMLAGGASACIANDAIGFPPTCTAPADCAKTGLKLSSCVTGYCIQICK